MYTYDRLFSEYNHTVAQILITAADVNHGERHENFRNTLNRLLELGVLPIINENDSIATEEIVIGDNDTLAAMVAVSANAELLILLSDIDGLYTADPHKDPEARLIETVTKIDDDVMALGGDKGSSLGTGGMRTKLIAAKIATDAGCDMIIANGSVPMSLYDMAEGKPVGTRFVAKKG
jgi:glutamate 5-kinase